MKYLHTDHDYGTTWLPPEGRAFTNPTPTDHVGSTFSAAVWPSSDRQGGECTGDFSKSVALRGLSIAFGRTFTTPSGVRSTPCTTGPGKRPSHNAYDA